MKKLPIVLAGVLLVSMLCGCEDVEELKEQAKGVQDTVSKYSQQIEDSKEVIEDGLDKMQGILDEAKAKIDDN